MFYETALCLQRAVRTPEISFAVWIKQQDCSVFTHVNCEIQENLNKLLKPELLVQYNNESFANDSA